MDRLLETKHADERIVLGLLSSLETEADRSQRHITGLRFNLVNAYLKRCVKKGLIKVHDAPARRYAYYLTPQGFAEKSRLTVQYLSNSFSFFRLAKSDCAQAFEAAKGLGFQRLVLAGQSDLAEIAILCALEAGITIVAVVDARSAVTKFVGVDVARSFAEVADKFDAALVTDVMRATRTYEAAVAAVGAERVLAPALLRLRLSVPAGGAK